MSDSKETVLFSVYSKSWNREMPVTLIDYGNNLRDLHCQTGEHHVEAIEKAKEILAEMNCYIDSDRYTIGGSGVYYSIHDKSKDEKLNKD